MDQQEFLIKTEALTKAFGPSGRQNQVLTDVWFSIRPREIVSIIGRSGSGKSTLLDLLMGLQKPDGGTILRANPNLTIGYVFQKPALLPWRTVARNVSLPLEVARVPKAQRLALIEIALERVGLLPAQHHYPFQLSGGMAQRVAIARAIVQDPELLLLDEPFSYLDPLLRENMNINLLRFWQKVKKTMIFVTHSIDEAVILSDRILVLDQGRFQNEFAIEIPRPRGFHTFQSKAFSETVRLIREHLPLQPNLPIGVT